jgi:hypothetical protein
MRKLGYGPDKRLSLKMPIRDVAGRYVLTYIRL